jgi:hypothetical protein
MAGVLSYVIVLPDINSPTDIPVLSYCAPLLTQSALSSSMYNLMSLGGCWCLVGLILYLLAYSMKQSPSWGELTGFQLVKKFSAFYGARRFITAFTSARHLSLSWVSSIQSVAPHPPSWISILILSLHSIQTNQPTRCNNFPSLLLDVYVQLNMFSGVLTPIIRSSTTAVAASGFTVWACW